MKKTYHGSCHCGAIRFQCAIDLQEETSQCNCSICTKTRFWKSVIPADAFRLLQGSEALSDYQFGNRRIHHHFCSRCGVKTFGRGHHDEIGEFYAINLAALDDATPAELVKAPLRYQNGRNNDWNSEPAETRHL
ncbi:MAG TPA: GFA family protein [Aestuariivirgaceae bacterium]|jgi:hypothetical protein